MKHLRDTGNYIAAFRELACHADDREKQILAEKEAYTEDDAWLLFEWASELVAAGTGKNKRNLYQAPLRLCQRSVM